MGGGFVSPWQESPLVRANENMLMNVIYIRERT